MLTGPAGWYPGARARCTHPPHSRPCRPSGGPLRWWVCSSRGRAGGLVVPGITHPVYPSSPQYPARGTRLAVTAMHEYDRRGDTWDMYIWLF